VHVEAEGAAVDLRRTDLDEFEQRMLDAAVLDELVEREKGAVSGRRLRRVFEPCIHARDSRRRSRGPVSVRGGDEIAARV
jgi:hypothetical protein